jgi:hypothetical protein
MGYPADGLPSLYRNRRSDVVRFLEPLSPYKIFNLVPRFENSYEAADFPNPQSQGEASVERFPFPDHHPPPLSLLPLASARAKQYYEADERNTVVIHCLAGKGRCVLPFLPPPGFFRCPSLPSSHLFTIFTLSSENTPLLFCPALLDTEPHLLCRTGSFALSLLLALPGLPSAPKLESSAAGGPLDPRAVIGSTTEEIASMTMHQKLEFALSSAFSPPPLTLFSTDTSSASTLFVA